MRHKLRRVAVTLAVAGTSLAVPLTAQATGTAHATGTAQAIGAAQRTGTQAATETAAAPSTPASCAKPLFPGAPVCFSRIRTDIPARHDNALAPHAAPSGYGPSDLQRAYNLASAAASRGGGATVAVTELADDPNLESDLATYRSQYGLPSCTTANGCFRKVNGSGQQGNYPPGDSGWGTEASLDIDMVSAVCPLCHILVIESGDLVAAQNTAVSLGARFISNSWGTGDGSGDAGADADFNHAGVADVASTGDGGYGVSFPATSRYVVAAGGTSLRQNSGTARGWTESAWSGAGAGCSSWESKPSWQKDTGCAGRRTVADVSAVADPGTGVAVYDTYGQGGWFVVGGTSASSPIIASVYALAGAPSDPAASIPYAHTGSLYDVTSGSDGSCNPSYLCNGASGYDGPTGLGTPNGLGAFTGGGSGSSGGPVTSGIAGKCLDDFGGSSANGTKADLWDCNGTPAQQWTSNGSTLTINGKCLDVTGAATANGSPVELWDCNGGGNQVWHAGANGSLVNPASGRCLDDPGFADANGTQLDIWDCDGGANQRWNLP
ncbi:ricin-type beta-trefoil lectin domain protein [Streptomyces sp. NPDC046985]|uniref:ricin-type beta-trefoil lectin domain protein n=1 Tax=Streptomyces sp. NPDC046985 TaxID=3155377 RepID=UPI0033DBAB6E